MNLEQSLQQHEERVDALIKSAKRYVSALSAWKKACRTGHLANRQKAAAQAEELAPALPGPTAEAAASWTFDLRDYLESDEWRRELEAATEKQGLRVIEDGDNLISSPVIVRAQPGRGVLQIGRINWPTIHPRVTAAELKRLRERAAAANNEQLLESLFAVWKRISTRDRPTAKFREIYDLFSLTPGWKRENSEAAFGQAIYALQRAALSGTRAGITYEIEYASGNASGRDVFQVFSEDGRAIRYYGIRFRIPEK